VIVVVVVVVVVVVLVVVLVVVVLVVVVVVVVVVVIVVTEKNQILFEKLSTSFASFPAFVEPRALLPHQHTPPTSRTLNHINPCPIPLLEDPF